MDLQIEEVLELFREGLNCTKEVIEDSEKYYFEIKSQKKIFLEKNELQEAISLLKNINMNEDEIGLLNNKYYEIHFNEINRSIVLRGNESDLSMNDTDNHISYSIGLPSTAYLIYSLLELKKIYKADFNGIIIPPIILSHSGRKEFDSEEIDIKHYYQICFPKLNTIKISTTTDVKNERMKDLLKSVLFHLSYNLNLVIVPYTSFDEIFRRRYKRSLIRSRKEDLESPKRIYIPELINYYQQGLSANVEYLKYISFYHILEYFFDSIYYDDLLDRLKTKLTLPDFSYKRKKDLNSIVEMIRKNMKFNEDEYTFDERTSLELVLEKLVDKDTLKNELDEIDPGLIEYYKNTTITFSNGNTIDFDEPDEKKFYKALKERIYKTRCSLIHSKSSAKDKYVPFRDDKLLSKEISLLKTISEIIIINRSTII